MTDSKDVGTRKVQQLVRRIEFLENAIRDCVKSFDGVAWGWDGDCGSAIIVAKLENALDAESA